MYHVTQVRHFACPIYILQDLSHSYRSVGSFALESIVSRFCGQPETLGSVGVRWYWKGIQGRGRVWYRARVVLRDWMYDVLKCVRRASYMCVCFRKAAAKGEYGCTSGIGEQLSGLSLSNRKLWSQTLVLLSKSANPHVLFLLTRSIFCLDYFSEVSQCTAEYRILRAAPTDTEISMQSQEKKTRRRCTTVKLPAYRSSHVMCPITGASSAYALFRTGSRGDMGNLECAGIGWEQCRLQDGGVYLVNATAVEIRFEVQ
jgi:hypothetical protein